MVRHARMCGQQGARDARPPRTRKLGFERFQPIAHEEVVRALGLRGSSFTQSTLPLPQASDDIQNTISIRFSNARVATNNTHRFLKSSAVSLCKSERMTSCYFTANHARTTHLLLRSLAIARVTRSCTLLLLRRTCTETNNR